MTITEATLQAIVEAHLASEYGECPLYDRLAIKHGKEMAQELRELRAEVKRLQCEIVILAPTVRARPAGCPKCHGYGRIMDGVISSQSYPCPACQSTVPLRSTAGAARHADALCDGRWG
jgi:hypothetical protein